ncbi:MAG: hypothetical protein H6765_07005 [Candidatus Peribacteria bacterium]|nr:MAG: hypothetical protein H6765_07005 [Candidatus Peribacteria bacterium]
MFTILIIMKLLDQAKNILGSAPLIAKLLVDNPFALSDTKINGKLQLIAKIDSTITSITYEITEHFEQIHNNGTENKVYHITKVNNTDELSISPLDTQILDFFSSFKIKNEVLGILRCTLVIWR